MDDRDLDDNLRAAGAPFRRDPDRDEIFVDRLRRRAAGARPPARTWPWRVVAAFAAGALLTAVALRSPFEPGRKGRIDTGGGMVELHGTGLVTGDGLVRVPLGVGVRPRIVAAGVVHVAWRTPEDTPGRLATWWLATDQAEATPVVAPAGTHEAEVLVDGGGTLVVAVFDEPADRIPTDARALGAARDGEAAVGVPVRLAAFDVVAP